MDKVIVFGEGVQFRGWALFGQVPHCVCVYELVSRKKEGGDIRGSEK